MSEQIENINRVREAIRHTIMNFYVERIAANRLEFTMDDLTRSVKASHPSAPDSAGRILRDLRQRGWLDYEVASRPESRYRFRPAVVNADF